ncbi:Acyl transferase/acyl hydrolase/lysophospholipase [Sesbania bispinosa]|nr:Acyl transferase/acyl hydrolase/lysophospholipase [Sesbania bispinosa]
MTTHGENRRNACDEGYRVFEMTCDDNLEWDSDAMVQRSGSGVHGVVEGCRIKIVGAHLEELWFSDMAAVLHGGGLSR